jgi:hypothetical protein
VPLGVWLSVGTKSPRAGCKSKRTPLDPRHDRRRDGSGGRRRSLSFTPGDLGQSRKGAHNTRAIQSMPHSENLRIGLGNHPVRQIFTLGLLEMRLQ